MIWSSMIAVEASGFTYFHKRYCIANLQLKRDRRYCFAKFTITILQNNTSYLSLTENLQYNISYENR
jgi:hypothetical protein